MADESVEEDLRGQLLDAFGDADYPVDNQMDLVPALPSGPSTKFESGGVSFTAMEMAAKLGSHQEFPYQDAETLVDDIMVGLREEGMI